MSDKFKKGDIVYHKATDKKCVVSGFRGEKIIVTTENDKSRAYSLEELLTEAEWDEKNENLLVS